MHEIDVLNVFYTSSAPNIKESLVWRLLEKHPDPNKSVNNI